MNRWLPGILIVALLAVFRVLGSAFPERLPNFQPLLAVFLCSLIFLKGSQRWLIPAIVWLLTDPITSVLQGYPILGLHHISIALGIGATIGIAQISRKNPTAISAILAAGASAFAFYFLTNFFSFIVDSMYSKDLQGFSQAQWTGAPGAMPTWIFLRNLVAANLAFTGLFLAARQSISAFSTDSNQAIAR